MTSADWMRVIDEAAALGVRAVQFIGGEVTLHPDLAARILRRTEHGQYAALAEAVRRDIAPILNAL